MSSIKKLHLIRLTLLSVLLAFLASCNQEKEPSKSERLYCEEFAAFGEAYEEDSNAVRKAYAAFERKEERKEEPWNWLCVGPNVQPFENNAPSSAIPTYAEGRGNGSGRINFLHLDEAHHRLFACSPSGGLFVSNNEGRKWTVAGTDQLPISGVAAVTTNPLNKKEWLIATGDGDDKFMFSDGVWRTKDGGESYENINGRSFIQPAIEVGKRLYSSHVLAHPCDFNRVFYACNQGLFVTNNSLDEAKKVKWKQVGYSHFYDIAINPMASEIVLAGGQDLMVSKDCGASWEQVGIPKLPAQEKYPFRRLSIEFSEAAPDIAYIVITRGTQFSQSKDGEAYLYKYYWKTNQWEMLRNLSEKMGNMLVSRARAFSISPTDSALILFGNVQPVYRSTNGGKDFSKIAGRQMHDDLHHLVFSSNGKTLWAAHDGGVSISTDDGLTFKNADQGIGASNTFGLDVAQSEEEILVYGGYDTGGNQFDERGWSHVNWGDGFECAIDPNNPDFRYTTRQFGYIHASDDGGRTYPGVASSSKAQGEWHSWFRLSPSDPSVLFSAGKRIVRTSNYGKEHEVILTVKDLHPEALTCYRLFVSESHPDVVYAYILRQEKQKPLLAVTFNAMDDPEKVKWNILPELPKEGWISDLEIDNEDPRACWLVYKDAEPRFSICRYTGNRFIDISANLNMMVTQAMTFDRETGRLYIGSNRGVYTKSRNESEWTLLSGLPGTYINSLVINKKTRMLYVGTFGRGIWKGPLKD